MTRIGLTLVVVLKRDGQEIDRKRFHAGSGAHLYVGARVNEDGFRVPVDSLGVTETQLFTHGHYTSRPENVSAWTVFRLPGMEITFTGPETGEKVWRPASWAAGHWCSLLTSDRGVVRIGNYTIEFSHEGGEAIDETSAAA